MPNAYVRIIVAGLLAGTVACGPVNSIRLRGSSGTGTRAPQPGRTPGELGGRGAEPTPRTGELPDRVADTRLPGERQVCRASAIPRGWIAIAYVSSAGDCPVRRGSDSVATAAVLTRYSDQAVGMELDVCADQVIPRDWVLAQAESVDIGRCPGATRGDAPTTKRIRRLK